MDYNEIDLKIKREFLIEATDLLNQVEDQFLIFEQNPNDSSVVDRIFRMAHTVKGSAMACGFLKLGEFAHVMETLLVKIREGKHFPDSETVDVLLRSTDVLKQYIELLNNDYGASLDTSAIEEEIGLFLGEEGIQKSAAPMAAFGFFDDEDDTSISTPTSTAVNPLEFIKGHRLTPIDEATVLSLKAYLTLSDDKSPEGIQVCLFLLQEALQKLAAARA